MNSNPLKQYFRRPAVYIKLPSNGVGYPSDSIDFTETGELPIYPMTAIDEITSKTPDALFNGSALVELIKSCVPNIKDPWQVSSADINALLIGMKIASGNQNLEINSKCPSCGEISDYSIDLISILNELKSPDYTHPMILNELKIYFKPLTYKEMNEAGLLQFNIQRQINELNNIENQDDKLKTSKEILLTVTKTTIEVITKAIEKIETPETTVVDQEYILDYLNNCDKDIFKKIKDFHQNVKEQSELKPIKLHCGNCSHEYEQTITLNLTDFFD